MQKQVNSQTCLGRKQSRLRISVSDTYAGICSRLHRQPSNICCQLLIPDEADHTHCNACLLIFACQEDSTVPIRTMKLSLWFGFLFTFYIICQSWVGTFAHFLTSKSQPIFLSGVIFLIITIFVTLDFCYIMISAILSLSSLHRFIDTPSHWSQNTDTITCMSLKCPFYHTLLSPAAVRITIVRSLGIMIPFCIHRRPSNFCHW